jgi:hypothetical protein
MRILTSPGHFLWGTIAIELLVLLPFASLWGIIVGAGGTRRLIGVCLKQQPVFLFSPSASHASLQTSIFQLPNRTTGAAVSLIKKSDVKNHLSPRHRTEIHLCPPESQPDATGFSAAEAGTVQPDASNSAQDRIAELSSSGRAPAPGNPGIGAIGSQAPATSKSVKP